MQPAAAGSAAVEARAGHLKISGTHFLTPDNRPWAWRGITSFRLLEQLAAGKAADVDRYLAWAAAQKLTVVRVLAMAKHMFELPPERGRAHLDDLFARAARHGLHVEIVALADSDAFPDSIETQVRGVAEAAARHPNAILELANEPWHPTQRAAVRTRAGLVALLPLVAEPVPVAIGALEDIDQAAAGDYVTFHFPRASGQEGWGHVLQLAEGHAAQQRLKKPVINDEPIGAGPVYQPGRRDDNPDRMRAAALLTRMTGMGGTFHYEGGLHSRIPEGQELAAFNAWQEAWSHLPEAVEREWTFHQAGTPGSAVRSVAAAAGAWDVQKGNEAWLLLAAAGPQPRVNWEEGWREVQAITWTASQLRRAVRTKP